MMVTHATDTDARTPTLYPVKQWHMPDVDSRLQALNRRAKRLNLPLLSYTVDHTTEEAHYKDTVFGKEKIGTYTVYHLAIDGQAPQYGDYTFIATLEHTDDGTIIRQVPNTDVGGVDWAMWRNAEPWCAHCQKQRQRNDTFLVYRDTDGAVFQVGRNCLQDFMGKGADLQAKAADVLTLFSDYIRSHAGSDDGWLTAKDRTIPLDYYLSYVAATIRVHGWVSAKEAQATNGDKIKTAHVAESYMRQDERCHSVDCHNREHDHITRTDADMQRVDKALAWCDALAERYDTDPHKASDFEHNMVVATRAHTVTLRTMGIAAYAVEASIRAEAKEAERQQQAKQTNRKNTPYPAPVGQRVKAVKVIVLDKRYIDGQFGCSILHTLLTQDGYTFKWFASSADLDIGAQVTMDATIKKHEVYKEWHSTVVTRCTVKE